MLQKSKIESDSAQIDPIHPAHGIVGMIVETDAVFGNVTEDGPNYRWLDRHNCLDDENPDWTWGSFYAPRLWYLGSYSGEYSPVDYRRYYDLVKLYDRSLQAPSSRNSGYGANSALVYTVAAGSAMLSISTALNALSSHAVCTAAFVAVAAVIGFAFGSIRTLDRIGVLAWIGAISIIIAGNVIHWVTWLGSTSSVALIAYIVASAIPVFSGLVSLIGALLGTFLTFHPYAGMWLYDNCKNRERTLSWYSMVGWCIFIFVAGTFLTIVGTYGSIVSIVDSYTQSGGTPAWSCADNSNST
ncbi:unnamed protein product [Aspergillus oryzae]|uniref:Unnamed protein product n=2 Tax=Aspergillus oryzae TaxID=5062 RepID=A0AAN5BS23_ASPOZ|nr:unnamed protein product [Aspergillus oryzae]GMF86200.1 unnamed protein product [Aspergillus oryzae]GMG02497.1 unnamed protein product [Aspergillus oryzae]GMG22381.1 unnamed protein product [Aspergillus oryzae]GMG52674.1 unnamed protein product [Aspergillus oryzae var. brunneus]